ncbi:hypothetical protein [Dactylosporangium sp. CA-233914]|uniref:hypothetical protein n=1 Tax=Dactylosporangium sp. CA-233914 TaxID=3239934 RepID=UPI003D9036CD
MSFGTLARKVRAESLPYGRRVNALAGCVERYQPIGFHATFAYLEHRAGPIRRDEAALLRAIDLLPASRDPWLADLRAYASRRMTAKRAGRGSVPRSEPNPAAPRCWYGGSAEAAMFAIRVPLRSAEHGRPARAIAADATVLRLATAGVEHDGRLGASARAELPRLRGEFKRLRHASGWPNADWPTWRRPLIRSPGGPETVELKHTITVGEVGVLGRVDSLVARPEGRRRSLVTSNSIEKLG